MATIILSVILYVSLIVGVLLLAHSIIRCESEKRNIFIAAQAAVFLYILGYVLEINSGSTGEAFLAKRLLYLGSSFCSPLYLLFIANYCEVKINRIISSALLTVSLVVIILIWTNDFHHLFYLTYELNTSSAIPYLARTGGPLHLLGHVNAFICLLLMLATLIYGYVKLKTIRTRLYLVVAGVVICTTANIIYLIDPFDIKINYVPLALAVSNLLFTINIMKYDMFDIVPRASDMAIAAMRDAFIVTDAGNLFLDANEAAGKLFPSIKNFRKYTPITQVSEWPPELSGISANSEKMSVQFMIPPDNHYVANISPIITKKNLQLGRVILVQDVTETVMMTKNLEEIAYTDSLTGIMNRRHFMNLAEMQYERLNRLPYNDRAAYVVMYDLDYFKNINDTYGHATGDEVLRNTSRIVKDIIRPYDLLGRYGGEEFILFVSDISFGDIQKYIERIRMAINASRTVYEDNEICVTASFGIAQITMADNLDEIIGLADTALYTAKKSGRNCVIYYESKT